MEIVCINYMQVFVARCAEGWIGLQQSVNTRHWIYTLQYMDNRQKKLTSAQCKQKWGTLSLGKFVLCLVIYGGVETLNLAVC